MSKTTDLDALRRGAPFTWGRILRIHDIGNRYALVEYYRPTCAPGSCIPGTGPDEVAFHIYVDGKDTCNGAPTLEMAILIAIAVGVHGGSGAMNGRHAQFAAVCLGLDDNRPAVRP